MAEGHRAKSGRWFSAAWWRGHWDVRDDDGEYADIDHLGSGRSAAEKRLHRQLKAEADRHEANRAHRDRPKPAGRREQLRADVRAAQHDQVLRAERQAMGYKAETAGFYGSDKHAQAEHSERRLTLAQADEEARKQAEADREEAEAYRLAKKNRKPAPAPAAWRDKKIRKAS